MKRLPINFRAARSNSLIVFSLFMLLTAFVSCSAEKTQDRLRSESMEPFPSMENCTAADPNPLPEKWTALALLTPFDSSSLAVSLFTYDYSVKAMRAVVADLEGGYIDMLTVNDTTYFMGAEGQCIPVAAGRWEVPAPDWVSGTDHNCAGIKPILDVDVQWWRYQAGSIGNWLWTRVDNGFPWRMMMVNDSNLYKLPVLGDFSMTNFMAFEAVQSTDLPELVQSCRASVVSEALELDVAGLLESSRNESPPAEREAHVNWAKEQLGDASVCQNSALPSWPQTLTMTALLTPVNRTNTYPSSVAYDWNANNQLTAMLQPDSSVIDAYLLDTTTFLVQNYQDGTHKCEGIVPHLGPPSPRWAFLDECECKLLLNGGPLSPNRETVIFTCPIENSRVFWIWYSSEGMPIVFFETSPPIDEGTSLSLADYYSFNPNVSIPPGIFNMPENCYQIEEKARMVRFHGFEVDYNCNGCHNPVGENPNLQEDKIGSLAPNLYKGRPLPPSHEIQPVESNKVKEVKKFIGDSSR